MTHQIELFETTPLVNYIYKGLGAPKELEQIRDELMAMCFAPRKTKPVDWLKSKLGKQNYTWVGNYRYWVWEGPFNSWRVFANNTRGISFEVNCELNVVDAKAAWKDFTSKIGLPAEMVKLESEHPGLFKHMNM